MIKRGLAVVALIGAVAGAAYLAYRYLRSRQPEPESLPGAPVWQPLPATGLTPAPVAMPAEVGIEAAEPSETPASAEPTGIYIPRPGGTESTPEAPALEDESEEEAACEAEPELPSAAELEAEESIAEIAKHDEAPAAEIDELAEEVERPGDTIAVASEVELGEADLAEALLEERDEATEAGAAPEPGPDLWSPSVGAVPASADPVLARFEALAATEDIVVESVTYESAETAEVEVPPAEQVADVETAEPEATDEEAPAPATGAETPESAEPVAAGEPGAPSASEPTPLTQPETFAARSADEASAEDTAAADALLDEGNAYFNVGQFSLAIQRYDRAIQLAPRLVAAFYNRANARTRIGDYDGAQSDYDTALGLNPTDADALNNRGMLHLYRGNHNAALQDFNLALGIDSRDGTVIVNRGLAYLHQGDARAALSDFHEAIRLDSRDGAAHYGAAQSLATLGDANAALMSLRNALRIEPSYAREAAAEPRFASLQSKEEFTRLLRNPNG